MVSATGDRCCVDAGDSRMYEQTRPEHGLRLQPVGVVSGNDTPATFACMRNQPTACSLAGSVFGLNFTPASCRMCASIWLRNGRRASTLRGR